LARRVVLHIGTMKSGTSFLQGVLDANREALAGRGVQFAGERWRDQVEAIQDVADSFRAGRAPGRAWRTLADSINAWPETSVVSMEFLAARGEKEIAFICGAFGDAAVEVVMTARDLTRTVPSMWLESTQNGATATWETYLREVRAGKGRSGDDFHRHQDLPAIAQRWSAAVGKDRFTVVTVPPPGAPHRLLWDRFAGVLGVEIPDVDLDVLANPGIGLASALLLRRLNEQLRARGFDIGPDYLWLVKRRLAKGGLAYRTGEQKLGFDARWARRMGERHIAALRDAGYRVVGDLSELAPRKVQGVQPKRVSLQQELDAAVDGLAHTVMDLSERAARRRQERGRR
jgi:hypothetical protein